MKYNYMFRYYLLTVFIIIFLSGLFFIIKFIDSNKFIKNLYLLLDNDTDNKNNTNNYYCEILKKILIICNNPIKFDYQINQLNKINDITKYKKIEKDINLLLNKKHTTKFFYFYEKISLFLKNKKIKEEDIKLKIINLIYINYKNI